MSLTSIPTSLELSRRDRFLAFAFAASDLLVEVRPDGMIDFAAGAFNAHFGTVPDLYIGRHLRYLFCTADHAALDMAIFVTALRGRLPPMILHLSDTDTTPVTVSGLALPSAGGRMSFTLGRLPQRPAAPGEDRPMDFSRLLEQRIRGQDGGVLSLVDLGNWPDLRASIPAEHHQSLLTEITDILTTLGGPGAIAGEIADGRYGILSERPSDLQALAGRLESLLRAKSLSPVNTQVTSTGLALDRNGLTGAQAARALRFALARFAEGGVQATSAVGFQDSLAGFIASAEAKARQVRSIITNAHFRLVYQPVVHLVTREVHHYEALLRPVFTPGVGIETTQDFVTFAEAVGLSEELDLAVMAQALVAAQNSPHVSIAVNVSGLSMQSVPFRERMIDMIANASGTVAGRMLVELTETADIEDVPAAAESVAGLRAMNVPVCIDDFGAGSAAFRYLREFRVDYVKLDGAYVRGALHNAREHGFLLSMVELANFVGAKVIAETIETEPQAKLMREVGVEYGQGWLFGRPGSLPGPRHAQPVPALSGPSVAATPR
jgi:EAL domain-containing protein (putative c-di-GMP-specific phosphodiesterase class I)